jgi:hypothetical protein
VDVVNRGKYQTYTQNPATGLITIGPATTFRTPWYMQTDFNFQQNYKISEQKVISFSATFSNLFNQHSVTVNNGNIDSSYSPGYASLPNPNGCTAYIPGQCILFNGPDFYAAALRPYNLSAVVNSNPYAGGAPITVNSQYGNPLFFQLARNIRLGVKFTF